MKVIIKLGVRVSETESTDIIVQEIDDTSDLNAWGEEYAKEYYSDAEEMDGEYYSDGGGRAVYLSSIKEVSDSEYKVLCKYV